MIVFKKFDFSLAFLIKTAMCSLCDDSSHIRLQCPFGYLDYTMYNCEDIKLAHNLLLLANGKITPELVCLTHFDEPIEELPEFFPDPVLPTIQSVLRPPSDTLGITDPSKKTIRFNDKDNVKTFDAPLSENLNPKKKEPYHPKDVSEYRARTGKWWDKDEDET